MSEKRKDNQGRILKDGENQRKDLTYMYRYNDIRNQRRCVYAKTLAKLREKEEAIQRDLTDGIDHIKGEMPMIELIHQYVDRKNVDAKYNTKNCRNVMLNLIKKTSCVNISISAFKRSTAREMIIEIKQMGKTKNTLTQIYSLAKAAFNEAVEDDILRKNPFSFKLSELNIEEPLPRTGIDPSTKQKLLDYVVHHPIHSRYYNDIRLLLCTGMRVSEMYGLTKNDINLEEGYITVRHQLLRTLDGEYYISLPKTQSGTRAIPINAKTREVLLNIYSNRQNPKAEFFIDGCGGFLFLHSFGRPRTSKNLESRLDKIVKDYNSTHLDAFPHITPHMLRHTFCTEAAAAGMQIKSLQYIMGHSRASVTLDVYTRADMNKLKEEMDRMGLAM